MTTPLVSIIIPAYNAEAYVGEAIESALGQTYPRVEVIAVDDGSSDSSQKVIRGFGDRVTLLVGPNRGAAAARNRGVGQAGGELVQFLDADDLLLPEKISAQVRRLGEDRDALVYSDARVEDLATGADLGRIARCIGDQDPVCFVLDGVLQTAQPLHWATNLRRVSGFRETLPCAQERDLHLRLASTGIRFIHLPTEQVIQRRRSGSVSEDPVRALDQHLDIVHTAKRILGERDGLTDGRAEAMAGLLARDGRLYLRHGHPDRASDYFAEARQLHRTGGVNRAYAPPSRLVRRLLGPRVTERLVVVVRTLRRRGAGRD